MMVFVHAEGSNGNTWHRQLAALADAHSPLAFDFPGHGRSGGTESLKSIEAYSDCLAELAAALHLRPALIVGRSMGAAVAMDFAVRHPQRVRGLVLVAAAQRFDFADAVVDTWKNVMSGRAQQPFTAAAFSAKADFAVVRESWMEQVKTDPRVRYFDLLACKRFDATALLPRLAVPTLMVAGRDDTITPLDQVELLHRAVPGSRLVIIDDAGHELASEKADELNAALLDFATSLGRS